MSNNENTRVVNISIPPLQNTKPLPETWFERLFGFKESDKDKCHALFEYLKTQENLVGRFTTPSVAELRNQYLQEYKLNDYNGIPKINHCKTNDVLTLHHKYPYAVFQVASQLNCLEFCHPNITPDYGITEYIFDYTQGPACALACAVGTFYRNYLQIEPNEQINNLSELETFLSNYWEVRNGYIFSEKTKIRDLNQVLSNEPWNTIEGRNQLVDTVHIGLHEGLQVVFEDRNYNPSKLEESKRVSQCFCAAINCGYSNISENLWEPLAQIVLDANYEATIWAAAMNNKKTGTKDVFLTFLGGGVFRNKKEWIAKAIARAIRIAEIHKLDININICHHIDFDQEIIDMIQCMV